MARTNHPHSSHASSGSTARRTRRTGKRDPLAVTLLKKDHRQVEEWFDGYEQLEGCWRKARSFSANCAALKVHTKIEEEIFYPEERGDVAEDDMLDEAQVEHDGAKKLIAEIEAMKPSADLYDAKVKVLGEYIKHHVKEEEQPGGIFAQAKRGRPQDLEEMGGRLEARKKELMAQMSKVHRLRPSRCSSCGCDMSTPGAGRVLPSGELSAKPFVMTSKQYGNDGPAPRLSSPMPPCRFAPRIICIAGSLRSIEAA